VPRALSEIGAVQAFANAAARTAAIPSPTEGIVSYLNDVDALQVHNGSAWVSPLGLTPVIPTSISRGASGSASVSALGLVTFTGTESISLTNCFTSEFDHYKFILNIYGLTTNPNLVLRLRDGSGDLSSLLYGSRARNFSSLGAGSDTDNAIRGQSFAFLTGITLGEMYSCSYDIFSPNLVQKTTGAGSGSIHLGNLQVSGFGYNATTAATGLTIFPSDGLITGTLRVYGYRR
jgi:hypothetical protein